MKTGRVRRGKNVALMSDCWLFSARADKHTGKLCDWWYAAMEKATVEADLSLKNVPNARTHTETHADPQRKSESVFAMHYSLVSLFLRPVTRDGEQRAEQGDFIIPAVFILHPSDFCTSLPTSSSSTPSHPIPPLHLFSPVSHLDISDLIRRQKMRPYRSYCVTQSSPITLFGAFLTVFIHCPFSGFPSCLNSVSSLLSPFFRPFFWTCNED